MLLTIDGEIIKKVEPDLGYIHRSIEKMCERDSYQQIVHLTDRMDYLSSHINNEAVCLTVENALQLEIPERVKVIRTIHCRIDPNCFPYFVVGRYGNGRWCFDHLFLRF